jgi:phage shock protein A
MNARVTSIARLVSMPTDLEQLLREVLGDSLNRLNQFQSDQIKRLQSKLQELAREALKDELTRLHSEIAELRSRVAILEAERAQAAADSIQSSFLDQNA